LITGGSRGIGKAAALKFAEKGYNVVVTYANSEEDAKAVCGECDEAGAENSECFKLDVTDDESINEAYEKVKEQFGEVDVLVNNAGVAVWKEIQEQDFEEISEQVRTNLEGLIKVTNKFLDLVKDCIVNIGSGAGKTGYGILSTYCATKFGVRGFTQAISDSLEQTVYAVNPGMTSTEMTNWRGEDPKNVAEVIFKAASEQEKPSGSDYDVWEYR
ncbi:MAG: SDR family NAD(P)-dependent oxidoreductase, partial [Candidatus Pacearchaeota archaeon]